MEVSTVNITLVPEHTAVFGLRVIDGVTANKLVTTLDVAFVQPLPSVTVTVKVPGKVILIVCVVAPVDQL